MINFILGLSIGGVASIFVYRNNQKKLAALADKVDAIVKKFQENLKEES